MLRVQTLPSFVLVAPICYIDSIHNDQFVHKIMCRGQSSNSIYTECSRKWLVVWKIASSLIIVVYVYCSLHSIYFQMPVSIMIHFCNPILKLLACIIQYIVVTSGATGTCMRKHVISLILCAWILFTLSYSSLGFGLCCVGFDPGLLCSLTIQIRRSLLNEDEYGFRRAKRPMYYDEGLEVIWILLDSECIFSY